MLDRKGRIQREPQVRPRALEVVRKRVAGANDKLTPTGSPGGPDTRLEIGNAVVLVVERPACAVLTSNRLGAGDQIEVGLTVLNFHPRPVKLPAQAQVERQVRSNAPIVLVVGPEGGGALAPGSAVDASLNLIGTA